MPKTRIEIWAPQSGWDEPRLSVSYPATVDLHDIIEEAERNLDRRGAPVWIQEEEGEVIWPVPLPGDQVSLTGEPHA